MGDFGSLPQDFVDAVIESFTLSIEDSIILRSIGGANDTAIRNMIVNLLSQKQVWKKKELKATVEEELKKQSVQYPDKDIDKIINALTQQAGSGSV